MARRVLSLVLLLLLIIPPHSAIRAQLPAAGTAGAAIVGAQSVLDKLNDILVGLTGDAQIAVGGATQQFSDLINQVQQLAKNDLATPIDNLGSDIRVAVNNLQQVTTSFDALASKQRECIFQHLDLFVAGVQTVATGIKVLGIPIVSTAPRLISFTFDGQITPDVVPKAGGVALIKGVSVWTDRSLPPSVQLKAANYSIIGTLIPQPGDSINDFRVPIGADLISSRGGQCLYVDVTSYVQKSFVGIHFGKKQSGEETLPMCIPQQFNQSISMLANVAYSITTTGERTLSSKRFDNNFNQSLRNTSCEDRHNVSVSAGWDSEIPASWRIVRVQQSAPDIVNQSNIGVSFTSDSVTAAGWLDTATCFKTPFSASLIHDTHWYMTLTPVIDGPNTTNTQSSGSTLPVAMNFPTTSNICASVPKDPNSSGASSFWVTLTPYIHGTTGRTAIRRT